MPAKEKSEEPALKKPKGFFDRMIGTLTPTIDFFEKGFPPAFDFFVRNLKDISVKFFKVNLLAVVVSILAALALMLPLIVVAYLSPGDFSTYSPGPAFILLFVVLFMFMIIWISLSFSKTTYVIISEQFKGAYPGIISTFKSIAFPILNFLLMNIVIFAIAFGIPAVILYLLKDSATVFWIAVAVYVLYSLALLFLYIFFTQFWLWELLVGKKGAYESLKASISLVWRNLLGVIVFDVPLLMVMLALGTVFYVINVVFSLGLQLGVLAAMMNPLLLAVIVILAILVGTILRIIQFTITDVMTIPFIYKYWNHIRKKPAQ